MNHPERELILWSHESTTSTADAILNAELLPKYDSQTCILEVSTKKNLTVGSPTFEPRTIHVPKKRLLVSPVPLSLELRKKTPNLQLSLLSHLSSAFGINSRSIVDVLAVPKSGHVADYMVLYFKDQYISRSDMWRAACNLEGQCIYVGKRITFTGGIRADVREIWRGGKKKFSAYVSANTKPVFRSESARYLIFIQMSKEMWEFEEDGELFYNKAIDGFLPELFKKWKTMKAHHLVSIVLFTRVTYIGTVGPFCLPRDINYSDSDLVQLRSQLSHSFHNDFYKIVVDNVSSDHWESTLTELKRELHGFAKDVLLQKRRVKSEEIEESPIGSLTPAMQGNLLEAINLAAHQFNRDYIDRDLLRTGTSMLFVTAGTGVFEVDERLLKLTGESLLGNGIGMDIVCLSRRPLHIVPLFKYQKLRSDPSEETDYEYILPFICEISYYGELNDASNDEFGRFQPRLRMHEVQMMGRAEPGTENVALDYLNDHAIFKGRELSQLSTGMDARLDLYDDLCFSDMAKTLKILKTISKDQLVNEVPGEQIIQLLGTSVPSSTEKTNFQSLYEMSKGISTNVDGLEFSLSKASGRSNGSAMSAASRDSGNISPASPYDSRLASPVKSRSTFARFMHKLSDKLEDGPARSPSNTRMSHARNVRQFSNPALGRTTLKSRPSIASMTGAVTISSAMEQRHKTILTKGFQLPDTISQSEDNSVEENKAVAIPITSKEALLDREQSTALGKRLLSSIDVGEARAQSFSHSLRRTSADSRRRTSEGRSKLSLAVKYKPERPEAPDASPWHVLINPNFPSKNPSTINAKAWRWAHVSDRARRTGDMNWESMCAPAALPLTTTTMIDLEELKGTKYSENSYSIYIDTDDQPLTQKDLLREMIGQRLVQGFQIAQAVNSSGRTSHSVKSMLDRPNRRSSLSRGPLGDMGETIYVTHAQMEVHCITCDPSGHTIEVTRYVRKKESPKPIGYNSMIWQLAQDDGYEDSVVVFRPVPTNHSWNYVDQIISGVEERFTESVRYWRARFLLLPSELRDKRNPPPIAGGSEQFSEEEIKVAGINKICELLQKSAYLTPKEQRNTNKVYKVKSTLPVAVAFTTLDPTAYLVHENQHFYNKVEDSTRTSEPETKILTTADMSLYDYSNELQSARGIVIKDRLWRWRWYESSWVGSEFVAWLLECTDVGSRDEAINLAQRLMDQGLFEHVQKKHGFLDGFYLYRLRPEYGTKTAKTWYGARKVTPNTLPTRARAASIVPNPVHNSPTLRPQRGKSRFELSHWLRIDVDPYNKSQRPEFASLHYDT